MGAFFTEDNLIHDACQATPVQEALISATLQGNPRYMYYRIWDVQHVDIARLKLAMSMAFMNSDLLRSTFVVSGSEMYRVVRRDLDLPWKEWSIDLDDFHREDIKQGIELSEAFIRINVLNRRMLVISLHYALFDFWSNLCYSDNISAFYDTPQPQIHPTFKGYHFYPKDSDDGGTTFRESFRTSCKELEPTDTKIPVPTISIGTSNTHHTENVETRPESLPRLNSVRRDLDEEPKRDFWHLYLSDAKSSLLNHAPTESLLDYSRMLDLDLKAMSSALDVMPQAVVYAAWAFTLSLHLDSHDIIFATTVSEAEVSATIAEQLNDVIDMVVPQRVLIEDCDSFLDLILGVHQNLEKIAKHSKSGIRKALAANGSRSGGLLDTVVNFRNRDAHVMAAEPFPRSSASHQRWSANCVTLDVEEHSSSIILRIDGHTERRRLNFLLDLVAEILTIISSKPQTSLHSAGTLTDEETALLAPKILDETLTETLLGGFERAAGRYPSRIAIQWERTEQISYSNLQNRSSKLAAYLAKQGVKEGSIVPLLLEKSPLMIIAILAVMKLGAAYVPLSPDNPPERNAFIISEAASAPVLADSQCCKLLNGAHDSETIMLNSVDWANCAPLQDPVSVSPKHRAYLLYTSGSTGLPKGVTVTHGSCAAAIKSIIEFEGKQNGEFRALQFSNYVFDVSLYDFFVTLHTGGTLCIAPTHRLMNDLAGVINEMDVDHAFLTPTVARMLNPAAAPSMKSLTVGGEQVTRDIVDRWAGRVKLCNGYGPTECSVLVTMKRIDASTLPRNIGLPLPTVNAFILEKNGTRLAPYGAIGELCFSGPQLSEGYFKRPDLTALAFQETDSILNVTRFYRSGDLARWISPNELECLGRKDNQVKINGYRVELGEIENAFLKTGLVKECAAVTVERTGNHRLQLAAFVTFSELQPRRPRDITRPLISMELKEQLLVLKGRLKGLTPYMIPKQVIPLHSLPKLPSGKTDRKQLVRITGTMQKDELAACSFDSIRTSESNAEIYTFTRDRRL